MKTEVFESLKSDPDFQGLPLKEKQQVVKDINAGTHQWPPPTPPTALERPPPQDRPNDIAPATGVTPAPGVLNQPTDVETG